MLTKWMSTLKTQHSYELKFFFIFKHYFLPTKSCCIVILDLIARVRSPVGTCALFIYIQVNINPYNSTNPEVHPELSTLIGKVKQLTPSAQPLASNLTAAIQSAVSNFLNTTTTSYLKVSKIFLISNFGLMIECSEAVGCRVRGDLLLGLIGQNPGVSKSIWLRDVIFLGFSLLIWGIFHIYIFPWHDG